MKGATRLSLGVGSAGQAVEHGGPTGVRGVGGAFEASGASAHTAHAPRLFQRGQVAPDRHERHAKAFAKFLGGCICMFLDKRSDLVAAQFSG